MAPGSEPQHGRTLGRVVTAQLETLGGSVRNDPAEGLATQPIYPATTAEPSRGGSVGQVIVQLLLEGAGPYTTEADVREELHSEAELPELESEGPYQKDGLAELAGQAAAELELQPAGPYTSETRGETPGRASVELELQNQEPFEVEAAGAPERVEVAPDLTTEAGSVTGGEAGRVGGGFDLNLAGPYTSAGEAGEAGQVAAELELQESGPYQAEGRAELAGQAVAELELQPAGPYTSETRGETSGRASVELELQNQAPFEVEAAGAPERVEVAPDLTTEAGSVTAGEAGRVGGGFDLNLAGPYTSAGEAGEAGQVAADLELQETGPYQVDGLAQLAGKAAAELELQPAGPYTSETRGETPGRASVELELQPAGPFDVAPDPYREAGRVASDLETLPGSVTARHAWAAATAELVTEAGSYTNDPRGEGLWAAAPGGAVEGGDPEENPPWYPGPPAVPSPGANPWEPEPGSGARVGVEIEVTAEPVGQQFLNHPNWRPPPMAYRRRAYALGPFWRR